MKPEAWLIIRFMDINRIYALKSQKSQVYLDAEKSPFVFLEDTYSKTPDSRSFIFSSCKGELTLDSCRGMDSFFERMDNYLKRGFWLAGFFSYEFGYCAQEKLAGYLPDNIGLPLIWLGVFKEPVLVSGKHNLSVKTSKTKRFRISRINPEIKKDEYSFAISRIKNYIENGETYQVNFTFPFTFEFEGNPAQLYKDVRSSQPAPYSAFINTGRDFIISFSPELFFSLKEGKVTSRPMKGTISRGRLFEEDVRRARSLKVSRKNRAENVMIADLLRNDLGRVSKSGSVRVSELFSLEKYKTLWQMTSQVEADIKGDVSMKDIFKSLFPCGSVTGAPKISTMKIIRELEKYPRGVYCGSIGYISPHKEMCFNVAIRTIHLNNKGYGTLGVGGGIVSDSKDYAEYSEAFLKAKFFIKKHPRFSLIETMRWDDKGYYLLSLHLKRLSNSCRYFDIPFN